MKLKTMFIALSVLCASCSHSYKSDNSAPTPAALPKSIDEAVANPTRDPANRLRDQFRHPAETLKFFGLQPNMTVLEIWPSGGWYTQIIAPYVAGQGHYIAANGVGEHTSVSPKLSAWIKANPNAGTTITMTEFDPPKPIKIPPTTSVDMVLTFRNLHNWMSDHDEKAAFKAFFKVLKPGGTLGVVEHRANADKKQDPEAESGYVREDYVIKIAEKAGFKLVDKSEINSNPKDTKDYSEGVWTLPPSYRLEAKDHDKYAAIGESDRMTLKFVKPLKK